MSMTPAPVMLFLTPWSSKRSNLKVDQAATVVARIFWSPAQVVNPVFGNVSPAAEPSDLTDSLLGPR